MLNGYCHNRRNSIYFILIWFIFVPTILAKNCADVCGKGDEPRSGKEDEPRSDTSNRTELSQCEEEEGIKNTKVVNGYEPGLRGWMVMLRIFPSYEINSYETCGGALLNKRFVLSAAHCVCVKKGIKHEEYAIEEQTCDGVLHEDIAKSVLAFVGINNNELDECMNKNCPFIRKYAIGVEKVFIPKGWKGDFPRNDISLLKLVKDVEVDGFMHLPLCLPETLNNEQVQNKIQNKTAYVAGWGYTKNPGLCFTNNFGPERHVKCRKYFISTNREVREGCIESSTPSSVNKRCKQFAMANPLEYPKCPGQSIKIVYQKGRKEIQCYAHSNKKHGWCGTCNPDAERGERGYCPFTGSEDEAEDDPRENTIVRTNQNWGFCSPSCWHDDYFAKTLQETRITILTDDECKVFTNDTNLEPGDSLKFVAGEEFCAALKIPFPKMKVYERRRKHTKDINGGKKYNFKHTKTIPNKFNAKGTQADMDYYLGHTDSCQGDSGGPLWQYIDGRATIVGVVSRGGDCAAFNSPGIYTNVQKHLKWIKETISDYEC